MGRPNSTAGPSHACLVDLRVSNRREPGIRRAATARRQLDDRNLGPFDRYGLRRGVEGGCSDAAKMQPGAFVDLLGAAEAVCMTNYDTLTT